MTVDNLSTIAQTDKLIKLFGARYLKSHREKHLVNVVSQKMRTLASLVMQMQIEEPSIKTIQDCLAPKYFDTVVKSTKALAEYNALNDKFETPSLVLKIGHSLKQYCDIAEFSILKNCEHFVLDETQSNIQKSMKYMRSIIEKQWSYEVSTLASKEIYQLK